MSPENKNSQSMEKVKRSTRIDQRPKWLENYTCWRAGEETVCGMWVLLSSVIEFFILSSQYHCLLWFSFPGDINDSEEGSNTDCYNTFRYSLVAVIEIGFIQRIYMNNIAHILFVGISCWF